MKGSRMSNYRNDDEKARGDSKKMKKLPRFNTMAQSSMQKYLKNSKNRANSKDCQPSELVR